MKQRMPKRLFARYGSTYIRVPMALTAFLLLAAIVPSLADDLFVVGDYSSQDFGLFCYRSGRGTNSEIHLARYENGKLEEVFRKSIGTTSAAPICLSNSVIAVSADGTIRKLDLEGKYVFVAKPKDFEGVSGPIGRLDNSTIFMVESTTNNQRKGWIYYLHVVDVSGPKPVVRKRFHIIEPLRINRTFEEIVVVGRETNMWLKIP